MIEETVFYILASVFLGLAIIFMCLVLFYWIRTLRNFQKISSNLKEMSEELKEKITSFSGIAAGMAVLIKKILESQSKKKNKKGQKNL